MIKSAEVQTLEEVRDILEGLSKEEKEDNKKAKDTLLYLKKFVKIKPEHAKKLKIALQNLNLIKLNPKHIAKIIEIIPEDAEDLKKIFVGEDFSLEQDEINSILEAVKSNK
jgi:DNA-directed RNA polymerase subunit F